MKYVGTELEIFKNAFIWKKYWLKMCRKYIQGNVLEVGSGLGVNTILISKLPGVSSVTALEPDPELFFESIKKKLDKVNFLNLRIQELKTDNKFDTIIYIDVLEHIAEDKQEVNRALKLLKNNGKIIILSPAHQYLFSNFDQAIGHYRRYNKYSIRKIFTSASVATKEVTIMYLDSVGMMASLVNKFLLYQQAPKAGQVFLWDRILVRISKLFDLILFYSVGKSILSVHEKI